MHYLVPSLCATANQTVGTFLLTELVEMCQVCRLPHSHTPFQLCPQIFHGIEIRAL